MTDEQDYPVKLDSMAINMETGIERMEPAMDELKEDKGVGCLSKLSEASAEVNDSAINQITTVKFRRWKAAQLTARIWRAERQQAEMELALQYMAKGFEPDPGEEPHTDGYYYRTVMGRKIRLNPVDDVAKAVKKQNPIARPTQAAPEDGGGKGKKTVPTGKGGKKPDKDDGGGGSAKDEYTPDAKKERKMFESISNDAPKALSEMTKDKATKSILAKYDDFDVPRFDDEFGSPDFVVLYGDNVAVHKKDMPRVDEITVAVVASPKLNSIKNRLKKANKVMRDHLKSTHTIHRGMKISELGYIADNNGEVGHHPTDGYKVKDDFVSGSIHFESAAEYAMDKKGLVASFDVSKLTIDKDYRPMAYELKNDVRVIDGDKTYRPSEHFKGNHGVKHMHEAEARMVKFASPSITEIKAAVPLTLSQAEFVKDYVKTIEKNQGSPITVKYTPKVGRP